MSRKEERAIIPAPNYEIIAESGADNLLARIRPHWQAKNLIDRVRRLLLVDPSSACQRIFNAAIHDLREKLVVAGIDIASEAAKQNRLPPISRPEDVEGYTPYNTIELAYRVGLLSKPEARRMFRVYDIRGDLEHEDNEYEAGIEDCIYVFTTCIKCVLSRDPVEIIRLVDIKNIVEQPAAVALGTAVLDDYSHAPEVRQLEIHRFLVSNALNTEVPDIVRQNCYNALGILKESTKQQVLIGSASEFIKRVGRVGPDMLHARVAFAAGIFPYLKRAQLTDFFKEFYRRMEKTGHSFRSHTSHGELLRAFAEVGGLAFCPEEVKPNILEWLILLYIGEPGGYGAGQNRAVFYSNVGAPLAVDIIKANRGSIRDAFKTLRTDSKRIRAACGDQHVARRFERLVDLIESE